MKFFFFGFLIFLFFIPSAYSIGLIGSISQTYYHYDGLVKNISFEVQNSYSREIIASIGLSGDMAQYATLSENDIHLGPYAKTKVTVSIAIPSDVSEYGLHTIYVTPIENAPTGGMFGARAGIRVPIRVFVPYDGKMVETELRAGYNLTHEEFTLIAENQGTEIIKNAYGVINVYDDQRNHLVKLRTESASLSLEEVRPYVVLWDLNGIFPGPYYANSTFYYDGLSDYSEINFKIGKVEIDILNFTQEVKEGGIRKFEMYLQSGWNFDIENIYAKLTIKRGNQIFQELKTPFINLEPWKVDKVQTYIDTENMKPADYEMKIELHYETFVKIEESTLTILEVPKESLPAGVEGKRKESLTSSILTDYKTWLFVAILLFVIIDLYFILTKKKKIKKKASLDDDLEEEL